MPHFFKPWLPGFQQSQTDQVVGSARATLRKEARDRQVHPCDRLLAMARVGGRHRQNAHLAEHDLAQTSSIYWTSQSRQKDGHAKDRVFSGTGCWHEPKTTTEGE